MKLRRLFPLLVLLMSVALAKEDTVPIVGSVADIQIARPPQQEFVEVFLRIHNPTELSGATLVLITDTRDRGSIRKQMPLGSLFEATIPGAVFNDLKKQRQHQEHIEKSIDQGTPPEIISDAVMLAQVRIAALPAPLVPFSLKQ